MPIYVRQRFARAFFIAWMREFRKKLLEYMKLDCLRDAWYCVNCKIFPRFRWKFPQECVIGIVWILKKIAWMRELKRDWGRFIYLYSLFYWFARICSWKVYRNICLFFRSTQDHLQFFLVGDIGVILKVMYLTTCSQISLWRRYQ